VIAVDIDFPLHFDGRGRTAAAGRDDHVRDMIEQLLFTNPGERVNRPDFGSGLLELVFAPNSPELAAALQFSMQAALQRWLGDLIDIEGLAVQSEEGTLRVELQYVIKQTGARQSDVLERPGLP
jgi:Bacteriophage baseplate protein W